MPPRKEKFNNTKSLTNADRAYDAFMILTMAISQSKTKEEIKDNVMKIGQNYKGVSGTINFDENGDPINPEVAIKAIKDGQFVRVE